MSEGDKLFQRGANAKDMFFVVRGEFAYTYSGNCYESMFPGSWFCEAVLWVKWVHQGDMVAQTESCIVAVSSKEFRDTLLQYPDVTSYPMKYAQHCAEKLRGTGEDFFLSDVPSGLPFEWVEFSSYRRDEPTSNPSLTGGAPSCGPRADFPRTD